MCDTVLCVSCDSCVSVCQIAIVLFLYDSMLEGIRRKSVELIGTQMIYELVEYVKECLTDNNTPTEECAICLCNFQVLFRYRISYTSSV